MTQALALAAHLRDAGHEITCVLVGVSPWRSIPGYFLDSIHSQVLQFAAPAQVPGTHGRGLSPLRTAADAARRLPRFVRAVRFIADAVEDADVVVNFLELLGGLSTIGTRRGPPVVAIAHNHVFRHPALRAAPGPHHLRRAVLSYADATALGAVVRVALSFDALPDASGPALRIAPPLLRPGLDALQPHDGGYLLAYALNAGYGRELASWQARHPEVEVHCHVEGGASAVPRTGPGFRAHDLDQSTFLRHLAGCRAFVGSAGFESLCEAHWLGKPVLAVPTDGHFEQKLNAWDAGRCGVARGGRYEDLDEFWAAPRPPRPEEVRRFRRWTRRAPEIVVDAVERAAQIGA
jgi:uncharacterized protein (TIGR00661 family)